MFASSKELIYIFIVFLSLLIATLTGFIIVVVYRYKQKQNMYFSELEKLRAFHENAILQAQIEIQEQTFQNISRDIHDNVGQKLALARLQVIEMKEFNSSLIFDISNSIEVAIYDLRNLSRMLSSELLQQNGLIDAVECELRQLRNTELFEVSFKCVGDVLFLENNRELILFRIIQEGLQNILKHAKIGRIAIEMIYSPDSLKVLIKDDGQGFSKFESKGLGLTNMKSRAKLLGGDCVIASELNQGTTVSIIIPLHGSA